MAKTVTDTDSMMTPWWRTAVFGAVMGLVMWLVGLVMIYWVVEPISCGITGSSQNCSQATSIGGDIATILVIVGAMFGAIRAKIARPVLTALAAGILLWGLSGWLNGLGWFGALLWSLLLGALAVSLFAWINRTQSVALAVILSIIIIIAERIALAV